MNNRTATEGYAESFKRITEKLEAIEALLERPDQMMNGAHAGQSIYRCTSWSAVGDLQRIDEALLPVLQILAGEVDGKGHFDLLEKVRRMTAR